jgi:predicted hotdog family 3-hydroxylacyl-ACP dehydratase
MQLPTDIDAVLPHRDSLRLIDRVIDWQPESIVVEVDVPTHGLFTTPDGVPAWLGVDYMFACRILAGDVEVAVANVSVFEPRDAMAYLESGEA